MIKKNYDVLIIGAGPAGLMSAAAIKHKKVLVLEKNDKPGKKLLISGLGQCNFTNYCDLSEFLNRFGKKGRFLKPALYNFSNKDAISFFDSLGIKSVIREDNKVFPVSLKSGDILNALLRSCNDKNAEIAYNSHIEDVKYDENSKLFIVKTREVLYYCSNLIIATGGKSYPQTGSTGDGYVYAEKLGHTIVKTMPSLTPVYIENYSFEDLSGVSLKDINVTLWRNNKKINEFSGDLLFTHKNLSGPVIINNSRYIEHGDILKINFTEYKNNDDFKNFFEHKISSSGKLNVKTIIKDLNMPKRLADKLMLLSQVSEDKICSELDKSSRKRLIETISNFSMKVSHLGDYNIAMVTRGGVATNEINSRTMESKIIKNLYFAGEVIDIDGDTGGFNIQAALSTGMLAGENIADY